LLRFPAQHFSVACLCNQAETRPGDLTRKVADIYLADQLKEPPPDHLESSAKPVTVPDERLVQYAGLYWKKDDETAMRILHKEGKLFLSQSEGEDLELKPIADNRFELAAFRLWLTFDPSRLSVQGWGQEKPEPYEAVTAFVPTAEQLTGYAGAYVSAEIDPVYRIAVEKGGLVLKRLKSKPEKLRPTIVDYFESPSGDLHFERDSRGKITSFLLNSGRIRNFRFTRAAGDR